MNLPVHKYGKTERRKFGKINEVIDIPDLVEIQKTSYNTFINEGIAEVFEDFSPVTDYSDHYELYFLNHWFDEKPKYDEKECRTRDATIIESGAKLICLTALDMEANPVYDRRTAQQMADLGAHVGAMTPEMLGDFMGKIMNG